MLAVGGPVVHPAMAIALRTMRPWLGGHAARLLGGSLLRRGLIESQPVRDGCGLGAVGGAELGEDSADVHAGGLR